MSESAAADMKSEASPTNPGPAAPKAKGNPTRERTVYEVGGGRKTVLAFVFLLLLPFYASLGPMLFMRMRHGLWLDTVGLAVMAIAFTIIMAILLFQLRYALSSKVVLGKKAVKLKLPAGRGPTPLVRFKSWDIPYDDVLAVDTRREVLGGKLAPIFMTATRLVKRDGEKVVLGHVSERNPDTVFPFPEIGKQIADRSGIEVAHHGTVRRSLQRKIVGQQFVPLVQEADELPDEEIAELNKSHKRLVTALVIGLVILVGVGIAKDVLVASKTAISASSQR